MRWLATWREMVNTTNNYFRGEQMQRLPTTNITLYLMAWFRHDFFFFCLFLLLQLCPWKLFFLHETDTVK